MAFIKPLKWGSTSELPTKCSYSSLEIVKLAEGKVEFIAESSTKRFDGKRWHSATVMLTLTAEQVAELKAAL